MSGAFHDSICQRDHLQRQGPGQNLSGSDSKCLACKQGGLMMVGGKVGHPFPL